MVGNLAFGCPASGPCGNNPLLENVKLCKTILREIEDYRDSA